MNSVTHVFTKVSGRGWCTCNLNVSLDTVALVEAVGPLFLGHLLVLVTSSGL